MKNDDEDGDKADENRFQMGAAALLEHEGGMMGWVVGCLCIIGVEDYYIQHGGTVLQVQEVRMMAERKGKRRMLAHSIDTFVRQKHQQHSPS